MTTSADPPACPDCGQPWPISLTTPSCPSCGLDLEDLEAAADYLDRLRAARRL